MENRIKLEKWEQDGDWVRLTYEDGSVIHVKRTDFNRAFGAIVSASKEDVLRDFAIEAALEKRTAPTGNGKS